jgi:hypothetical protein
MVAALLAPELGWDTTETERQLQQFLASCAAEDDAALRSENVIAP